MCRMKPILAIRHVPHESLGSLERLITQMGLTFQYVDPFTNRPAHFDPTSCSGMIVLGGPMNADQTERYPFLAAEIDWIRAALASQTPLLGICLGSQLLAKAAGARVYPNPVKEIGWYALELTSAAADDRLFANCPANPTVFQWHGDTFDLPPGAAHLARSAVCRHQAFRVGHSAWGLQFHIEVTAEMIEAWLAEPGNCAELAGLDYIDSARVRDQTPRFMPPLSDIANCVLRPFVDLCRTRTSAHG
jgi:GMP synthase (glutamine-hydrolysing)